MKITENRQRISEAIAVDGRVLIVKATDDDQGLNAKLTYAIEQSLRDFKINSKTGEITVLHPLDRKTTSQYRFEVSATDHGNLPFKGTANVHITVTDVNDNTPRFIFMCECRGRLLLYMQSRKSWCKL